MLTNSELPLCLSPKPSANAQNKPTDPTAEGSVTNNNNAQSTTLNGRVEPYVNMDNTIVSSEESNNNSNTVINTDTSSAKVKRKNGFSNGEDSVRLERTSKNGMPAVSETD